MAGRLYRMAKVVSANPALWGVVDAKEVSGYKRVAKLTDLYSIAECILSAAYGDGTTDGADAIGQVWHVSENNSDYRLTNWANRKSASGWTKVTYGSDVSVPVKTAVQVTGAGETNILSNTKITVDAYTKAEVTSKVKEVTDLCTAINTNVDSNTKKITSLGTDVSSLKTSKADKSALDTTNTNLANLTTKVNNIDQTLFEVVTTLPSTTATIKKHIYLVKGTGSTGNVYDEWIYTGDLSATYDSTKWEKFGTVEADVNVGNAIKSAKLTATGATSFKLETVNTNGTSATSTITYPVLKGATSSAAGTQGLVPAPSTSNTGMYLRGDGKWATPTDTKYVSMIGATSLSAGASGLVPAPAAGKQTSFLRGDGTWVVPTNTTYSVMGAATASAAGTSGLVPAPAAGKQTAFLRGDGTWVVPTNTDTHYVTHLYVGATGTAANGATSNGATYLKLYDNSTARESHLIKGTGATTVTSDASGNITINSTNTTYSNATTSSAGLMSAADKTTIENLKSRSLDRGRVLGSDGSRCGLSGISYVYSETTNSDSDNIIYSILGASDDSASGNLLILGSFDKIEDGFYSDAVINRYAETYGSDAVIVDSPYVLNDISISGNTVTVTKGDRTTKTLTLPSYSIATGTKAGLLKPAIYYSNQVTFDGRQLPTTSTTKVTVNSVTDVVGKYYAVVSDSAGTPFVNVPWVNTNTTVSSVSTADSGNNVNVTVTSSDNTSKTATVCSKLTESEILAILN